MWGTFSAIAHFERRLISERMMDGIDAARVKVSPTEAARQRTSAFPNCSSLALFSVLSAHCPHLARRVQVAKTTARGMKAHTNREYRALPAIRRLLDSLHGVTLRVSRDRERRFHRIVSMDFRRS